MPQLERIIAIDNISKNKIISIQANEHTNFNGDNGSGKTTTLRASLLFYGSKPSDIAKAKGDSFEGFARFYFPRPTSYLVYEYSRGKQIQCVICFAVDNKVQYQFLDSEYQESLFVNNEGPKLFLSTPQDIRVHTESKGIELSPRIGPELYAEIIQSNLPYRKKGNNSELVRSLRGKFSLAEPGTSFRYVDRVLSNIFSSKASVSNIQSALTNILIQDNMVQSRVIQLDEQSGTINDWFLSRDAWLSLEARRGNFFMLAECAEKNKTYVNSLSTLFYHSKNLMSSLTQKREAITQAIEELTGREILSREKLREAREFFGKRSAEINGDIQQLKRNIEDIKKIKINFEQGDNSTTSIQQLISLHENVSHYQLSADEALETYNKISQGVKDILSFYDAQESKIERAKALIEVNSQGLIRNAEKEYQNELSMLRELFSSKTQSIVERSEIELEKIRKKISAADRTLASKKSLLENDSYSIGFRNDIESANAEISGAEKDLNEALVELRNIQKKHSELVSKRAYCNSELVDKKQHRIKLIHEQSVLKSRLDNGTLLDFLSNNAPGFELTLGKVVNPSLLSRKDLNPRYTGDSDSFLGLSIDLSVIDESSELSINELSKSVIALDDAIANDENKIKEIEKNYALLNSQISKEESAIARAEIELNETTRYLSNQRAERDGVIEAAKVELAERHNTIKSEISILNQDLLSLNNELRDTKIKNKELLIDLKKEEELEASKLSNEHNKVISSIRAELTSSLEKEDKKITSLKLKKEKDVESKGLSHERLAESKSNLDAANNILRKAQAAGERVGRYRNFMATEWVKIKTLNLKLEELSHSLESLKNKSNDEEQSLIVELNDISEKIKTHSEQLLVNQNEITTIDETNKTFEAMNITPRSFGEAPNIANLTPQQTKIKLNSLRADMIANRKRGNSEFNIIETVFCSSVSTPSRKFYEKMRSDILDKYESSDVWWASSKPLMAYIEGEHQTHEELLKTSYMLVAKHIVDFSSILMSTHKALNGLGRKLTSATKAVVERFDAIGNIEIKVSSKLKNLSYFAALESFSSAHENWLIHNSSSLPDDSLIGKLTNLVHMIGNEKLQVNIDKSFLFEVELEDNGRVKRARTDDEIENLSSTGLSYLIITAIYIGLINLLRSAPNIKLMFCVDEIGRLSKGNTGKLIELLEAHNIVIFSALPDANPDLLKHYPYAYNIVSTGQNSREYHLYTEQSRVSTVSKIDALLTESKEAL